MPHDLTHISSRDLVAELVRRDVLDLCELTSLVPSLVAKQYMAKAAAEQGISENAVDIEPMELTVVAKLMQDFVSFMARERRICFETRSPAERDPDTYAPGDVEYVASVLIINPNVNLDDRVVAEVLVTEDTDGLAEWAND